MNYYWMGGWFIYERRRKEISDIRALYSFFVSTNFNITSKSQLGKMFIKQYSSKDLKRFNKDFINSVKLLNSFVINRKYKKIKGHYELEDISPHVRKITHTWSDFVNKLNNITYDVTFDEHSLVVMELFSSYAKSFNKLVKRTTESKNWWKELIVFLVLALIGGLSYYFIFWA